MAKPYKTGSTIKPKKSCCESKPRCTRCPIALERLAQDGFAERRADGAYLIVERVKKDERKKVRKR